MKFKVLGMAVWTVTLAAFLLVGNTHTEGQNIEFILMGIFTLILLIVWQMPEDDP
jgi:hypothetical protein